jgi:hypothetical protein
MYTNAEGSQLYVCMIFRCVFELTTEATAISAAAILIIVRGSITSMVGCYVFVEFLYANTVPNEIGFTLLTSIQDNGSIRLYRRIGSESEIVQGCCELSLLCLAIPWFVGRVV